MLSNKKDIFYGILTFAVVSITVTILVSDDKLRIGEVLGQQVADNNTTATFTSNTGTIEVSIVHGAAALGDKAYSPNPINIKVGDMILRIHHFIQSHLVVVSMMKIGDKGLIRACMNHIYSYIRCCRRVSILLSATSNYDRKSYSHRVTEVLV